MLYIFSAPVSLAGRPLLTFHPESIKKRCFPPPWLYIIVDAVSGGVLLVIVLVAIVYANRWSLRLRKYHFKRWLRNRSSPLHSRERFERLDESFRYDVFVSYGPSDESRLGYQRTVPQTDTYHCRGSRLLRGEGISQ